MRFSVFCWRRDSRSAPPLRQSAPTAGSRLISLFFFLFSTFLFFFLPLPPPPRVNSSPSPTRLARQPHHSILVCKCLELLATILGRFETRFSGKSATLGPCHDCILSLSSGPGRFHHDLRHYEIPADVKFDSMRLLHGSISYLHVSDMAQAHVLIFHWWTVLANSSRTHSSPLMIELVCGRLQQTGARPQVYRG